MHPGQKGSTLSHWIFRLFLWVVTKFSPSVSHRLMVWGLRDGSFPSKTKFDPVLQTNVCGCMFKNPIGVAGGIDKRGNLIDRLIEMGWGFGEFGSYTIEAEYPPKDVTFLKSDQAILVRSMGYRNPGISTIAPVLAARRRLPYIVGVSITTTSQNEKDNIKSGAVMSYEEEFAIMASKVAPYCDFVVLNLAHPDCELYRVISEQSIMIPLLENVKKAVALAAPIAPPKIVVKIPLDVTPQEVPLMAKIFQENGVDAVIVAGVMNIARQSKTVLSDNKIRAGMLSGKPLKTAALNLVKLMYMYTNGHLPIIACGGISNATDAYDYIKAGASLIQINTAITYKGPNVVNVINKDLAKVLKSRGYKTVAEAVGSDYL